MSSTQHPAHRPAPRGRRLAALASVAGLALAGAAVAGAPSAQSAPPPADCAAAFPVSSLAQGDPVSALSVTSGTTPQTFTGSVIGVLKDGIGAGVDMVMVRIDPPSPDGIGGIWQGMSGSPVYAADGRLVGAIAYGLSYGPSWVAGVTPYEDMDDYLGAARPGKVQV
ncbi:MAG: SpoIVB peptidase S55 domain-containing protein, partial [Nocardioides sp.]